MRKTNDLCSPLALARLLGGTRALCAAADLPPARFSQEQILLSSAEQILLASAEQAAPPNQATGAAGSRSTGHQFSSWAAKARKINRIADEEKMEALVGNMVALVNWASAPMRPGLIAGAGPRAGN